MLALIGLGATALVLMAQASLDREQGRREIDEARERTLVEGLVDERPEIVTRLGNLLGLLDREEVPESRRHRVWLGASNARL